MSTKLYWHPNYQTIKGSSSSDQTDLSHPTTIPEFYIPPVSYIQYAKKQHENHSYYKCPAWQHYWGNTYVVFNQIDISFKWQKSDGLVYESSFDKHRALDYLYVHEGSIGTEPKREYAGGKTYPYKNFLVVQWSQSMMFWPKKPNKNLWIETIPFPDLHHKTGMELIVAEFPLGRWLRSVNGAYRCHAETVNVPRGTPMYCVRFRGGKDGDYLIERWPEVKPPDKVRRLFKINQGLKTWLPGKSWNLMKNDVEEKKCPFNFLFK